ncbi:MAG: methyltransferase, partial [Planctomycetota bacterium]
IARECSVDFLQPLGKIVAPGTEDPLRLAALRVLEEQPVPALARRIVSLLGDPAEAVRSGAARALLSLVTRDPESASALGKKIDQVKPETTRLALARILATADRPEGTQTVHFLLDSRDPGVRLEAVRAFCDGKYLRPWPPGLYRKLADPDPDVFRETFEHFEAWGERRDVPEIVPLLADTRIDRERRRIVAGLLDRLAGTDFGFDPPRFRKWALRWMAGAVEATPPSAAPETVPLDPVEPGAEGDEFPWRAFLTLALIAVLAGVGFLLSLGTRDREPAGVPEAGSEDDRPGGTITTVGKWIFDNRILVLLPWFLPPLLLFEVQRMPGPGWRVVLYGLVLVGVMLRVYCTGFRSWAYRSSGDRHLMTAGPYAHARHPIYMANFLLAVPFFLAVNLWPLTAAFVVWYVLAHLAIVLREDEILQYRYGEEWRRYAAHVRRFLPRLTPYEPRSGQFRWEPVVKGMEIPKAVAFLLLLPLALELLSGSWTALSARTLHGFTRILGG